MKKKNYWTEHVFKNNFGKTGNFKRYFIKENKNVYKMFQWLNRINMIDKQMNRYTGNISG